MANPIIFAIELRARAVVLATGVSYRRLGIESIDSLLGTGVFYGAATAEAKAMKGQEVYLVGAGNSAGPAAVHLSKYAARVTMLVRGESLKATMSAYLIQEIERTAKIDVRLHTEITGGRGEHRLEGLVLHDRCSGATDEVPAVALFILIGTVPKTEWLADAIERDEKGFVLTGPDLLTRTDSAKAWTSKRPTLRMCRTGEDPVSSGRAPIENVGSSNVIKRGFVRPSFEHLMSENRPIAAHPGDDDHELSKVI